MWRSITARALTTSLRSFPTRLLQSVGSHSIRRKRVELFTATQKRIMATGEGTSDDFSNRLAQEASPYLLQHAKNPVDWYPWGEEAISKSRTEQKPIFLSIGYSTCHWCHVMEHESFEDVETANLLNEHFVPVKVDKEERPDVDRVYMSYVQAFTGHGGWPMSVFLTPDLKPFFGGTYFPKEPRFGMKSFKQLLAQIIATWSNKRDIIIEHSEMTMEELSRALKQENVSTVESDLQSLTSEMLKTVIEQLKASFDKDYGGFSQAPKFPRPSEIHVLLAEHHRVQKEEPERAAEILHMIQLTLEKMSNGGIYDHIGDGFHRYSVDEIWHVPHFEKMLYDNAQLAITYLDLYQLTQEPKWAKVATGILKYLTRDLLDPKGGIYSAEDADSLDDVTGAKKEGAFYVWSSDELKAILNSEDYDIFAKYYQVKKEGNCTMSQRSDPHGEFLNKNCLFADPTSLTKMTDESSSSLSEIETSLERSKLLIFEKRESRTRPHLDNKVVTVWNGMAMFALAKASDTLKSISSRDKTNASSYVLHATKIAEFIQTYLWDENENVLRRSYCGGVKSGGGFADDYAWTIAGLIELYKHTTKTRWLKWAIQLQERMDELFYDHENGGYFATKGDDPNILLRLKEEYDSAEPTASSIGLKNLVQLATLCSKDEKNYMEKAQQTIQAFSQRLKKVPVAMPHFIASMYLYILNLSPKKVVICGSMADKRTQELLDVVHGIDQMGCGLICIDFEDPDGLMFWKEQSSENLRVLGNFIDMRQPNEAPVVSKSPSEPLAFVCSNFTCKAPTSSPEALRAQLVTTKTVVRTEFDINALLNKK